MITPRTLGFVLCSAALIAALLAGCGTHDKQAQQQPVKDSLTTVMDSSSVPSVLTDTTHVHLRYLVFPGEVYRYHEVVHSLSKGTFNNNASQAKEESEYWFTIRMLGMQPDSSVRAIMIYDSISVKLQTDQKVRVFNSNDSTLMHDPQYSIYSVMIKYPVPITVARNGDIEQVDSLDPILDKIFEASGTKKDSVPQNVREQVLQQLSESGVKAVVQHVFTHFSTDAIAPSGTWDTRFRSLVDVFPTDNVITYTLDKLSLIGSVRTATVKSQLDVKVLNKHSEDSTAVVNYRGGSFDGEAITDVDLVHGLTMHKHARMQVYMELSAIGRGAFANGVGDIKKTTIHETTLDRI